MYTMGSEEIDAVRRVIESGMLFRYRGDETSETDYFEREWAEKIGVAHALAVTSGTAALTCALVGLNLGPGDEVIVPAYTWIATALAPLAVGAIPVLAEVDTSLTLDPADVERKITPRTKAIIPVHMCGLPCNMTALMDVAARRGLRVVEDSCQANGGSFQGRRLGSIGHVGCNSFNYFKIITCGEGGAVVTNDMEIHQRAMMYHDAGIAFRPHADQIQIPFFAGSNYRMNDILSAILRVQTRRLDGILQALRNEKQILREALAGGSPFTLSPVNCPEGDCGTTFGMLFDSADEARAMVENLAKRGVTANRPIDTGRHVYTNWEPIIERRGAHHPARDPYQQSPGVALNYARDMCPKSLDYLARTVFIATSINRPQDELARIVDEVKTADLRRHT
ncbi:MAG: DegT/DnrJ/EryC1/StrS family aminotransferase [Candidatus Hydrogenedentes bacterium]|nr:DegT/DnrJ/EryC1/StrS family aminotransferase [Candidatus Hydrogenedentota bacterium]